MLIKFVIVVDCCCHRRQPGLRACFIWSRTRASRSRMVNALTRAHRAVGAAVRPAVRRWKAA
ncbi:MAG: hypothetical protein MZV65_41365 [Chromatiales bacterium]|nr:hypothetical protein [Chromatiales bacterium]